MKKLIYLYYRRDALVSIMIHGDLAAGKTARGKQMVRHRKEKQDAGSNPAFPPTLKHTTLNKKYDMGMLQVQLLLKVLVLKAVFSGVFFKHFWFYAISIIP